MTTHAAAPSTKRQAIIETAERLFAECGYDATSTARIAHEAGVPSGLVFYHFATTPDPAEALGWRKPSTPSLFALPPDSQWLRQPPPRGVSQRSD